jgi:lipoprotein-releasing system ATP-binding protein
LKFVNVHSGAKIVDFAPMLTARNLEKSHGPLKVLRGIDLDVYSSEVISIVGPSGAGKTTLLNMLSTLDRPDTGSVNFEGLEVGRMRAKEQAEFRNAHIGFVFQFHQLMPEFTAIENAMLPALIGGQPEAAARHAAQQALCDLGLGARLEHLPSAMSGGEQQRVAVARAMINKPRIIFADEPSGNLDSESAAGLHDLLFDLREKTGTALVLVTHNDELASRADRTITLRDGLIVDQDQG